MGQVGPHGETDAWPKPDPLRQTRHVQEAPGGWRVDGTGMSAGTRRKRECTPTPSSSSPGGPFRGTRAPTGGSHGAASRNGDPHRHPRPRVPGPLPRDRRPAAGAPRSRRVPQPRDPTHPSAATAFWGGQIGTSWLLFLSPSPLPLPRGSGGHCRGKKKKQNCKEKPEEPSPALNACQGPGKGVGTAWPPGAPGEAAAGPDPGAWVQEPRHGASKDHMQGLAWGGRGPRSAGHG